MTRQPPEPEPPPPPGAFNVPVPLDSQTNFSSMPPPPPVTEQASASPEPEGKPRIFVVVVGIAAAVFISLVAVSVLYYRWYKSEDYETTIVVWGFPEWSGATVEVTGPSLPEGKLTRKLEQAEHLVIRFHVPPGSYTVRVEKDGKLLAERSTDQRTGPLAAQTIWWPFQASPAATRMGAK
jgi:hypothetical protein